MSELLPSQSVRAILVAAVVALAACQATVKHTVDPIHITLDVNLKVDRELHDFFAFEREIEQDVLDTEPGASDPEGEASR